MPSQKEKRKKCSMIASPPPLVPRFKLTTSLRPKRWMQVFLKGEVRRAKKGAASECFQAVGGGGEAWNMKEHWPKRWGGGGGAAGFISPGSFFLTCGGFDHRVFLVVGNCTCAMRMRE